jgi:hypothetical protein
MTVDESAIRERLPSIPATTLDELIRPQPTIEKPHAHIDAPVSGGKQRPRP